MLDENWVNFTRTGNIYDYLKYKSNERNLKADNNAQNDQGTGDKGADNRGE